MTHRRLYFALTLAVAAAVAIAIYAVKIPRDVRPVVPELAPPISPPTVPAPAPLTTGKGDADVLRTVSVHAGDTVSSPLTVTGEARGTWYFEATFPARILDGAGKVLASGPAQAQGDWMTRAYVPFKVTLDFKVPASATGTLVLAKDNPSGMPEKDDDLRVPIRFK